MGLVDLLEMCLEMPRSVPVAGSDLLVDARLQDVILRAAEHVRELQAAGVRVQREEDPVTPPPPAEFFGKRGRLMFRRKPPTLTDAQSHAIAGHVADAVLEQIGKTPPSCPFL